MMGKKVAGTVEEIRERNDLASIAKMKSCKHFLKGRTPPLQFTDV